MVNEDAMAAFWSFLRSTIGLKVMMAVSGFILFGFCVEHLVGMMLFFKGPEIINGYGSLLRYSNVALWTARTLIAVAVVFHIWTATVLVLRQWAARPVGYQRKRSRTSSYAARTMKYSGPVLLSFVFFHLAHFTWGWNVTPSPFVEGDVYARTSPTASSTDGSCWCTWWEPAWWVCTFCTGATACSSPGVCGMPASTGRSARWSGG